MSFTLRGWSTRAAADLVNGNGVGDSLELDVTSLLTMSLFGSTALFGDSTPTYLLEFDLPGAGVDFFGTILELYVLLDPTPDGTMGIVMSSEAGPPDVGYTNQAPSPAFLPGRSGVRIEGLLLPEPRASVVVLLGVLAALARTPRRLRSRPSLGSR
ncbi:MAG: hypothetical protein GY725_20430 [bacterium]|nr:hypothetical protein [bacterium]